MDYKINVFGDPYKFHLMRQLLILTLSIIATAQLSLSKPTDVQCYGDPVTLVCTHPVLPQEPEYLSGQVGWRRDSRGISVRGLGLAEPNSTTTTLQFTITEDTIGNYTCFLTNAVRGGIVESNGVPVRPRGEYIQHGLTILCMYIHYIYNIVLCKYICTNSVQ